jgi:hypothetical protein
MTTNTLGGFCVVAAAVVAAAVVAGMTTNTLGGFCRDLLDEDPSGIGPDPRRLPPPSWTTSDYRPAPPWRRLLPWQSGRGSAPCGMGIWMD